MEGFFNRSDREDVRFRKLWAIIHDVNVAKSDRISGSIAKMHRYWPINIDKNILATDISIVNISEADMLRIFKERQQLDNGR